MEILKQIKNCTVCADNLPYAPKPIIQFSRQAKITIIGQAPGQKAHTSGIPWLDPSGLRLRHWLGVSHSTFYDEQLVTIVPMGFCYPGKGSSGDLPPRPECAPKWHAKLLATTGIHATVLIGKYAQDYYLKDGLSLTKRLKNWQHYLPEYLLLPHPSGRNNIWLKKNPWFEQQVLPAIKKIVTKIIKTAP
jgi:uracil-DNA glycosylase